LAVWGNGNFMLSVSECSILLRDLVIQRNDLKCDKIVAVVAEFFGYSPQLLVTKTRNPHVLLARQIAEYLAFRLLDCSLIELETYFERDRCTISYSIDKISKEYAQNAAMRSRVESLVQMLVPEQEK
jgi:chromosomal replication initiation ATPase DnaA